MPPTEVELPPAASAAVPDTAIVPRTIKVDGADNLQASEMNAAVSSYDGHRLNPGDVQDLLTAVSGVARAHGYLFAHSTISPQTMDQGILRITLDEGRIDDIRLTGDARPAVAAVLDPLRGHAPRRDEVERRLMIAADLPGVRIGRVSYAMENGRGVLIVPVTYARISGSAALDNRGLDALGPERARLNAWANWEGGLTGPISARLATTSQLSSAPLPAVEQLTIGGPYFGRGYNWSGRTGDEGVLGSAELRADVFNHRTGLLRRAQIYTFGDAGYVHNLETDFGTGDLYSAGAGARMTLSQNLNLELEAAFPINAVRYDSGDKSPRLSFSLINSF